MKSGVDEHPIMYDERILGTGEFVLGLTEGHAPLGQRSQVPVPEIVRPSCRDVGGKCKGDMST